MEGSMDSEPKDYAFKNEISLSIGNESIDSSENSTPSTVTPLAAPTPSPRQNSTDDTKPLTKNMADEKKSEGIDNKAFEASEKPPLTSFGNGHSNSLNETANGNKNGQMNEKKLAEAVNLELININSNNNMNMKKSTSTNNKQKSDQSMKKESDVEMGRKDDSYDEYFVPVNEHRKYMSTARKLHGVGSNGLSIDTPEYGIINYYHWINVVSRGEKLYVTKDKRAESRRNKLCWLLCLGIVAVVIILGICAASGAFNKNDSPVEARHLGDKINDTIHGASFGKIPDKETSSTTQSTTTLSTTTEETTEFSFGNDSPSSLTPVDEEITYVPNSLEGQITLSDAEYSSEYSDERSPVYKKMIKDLENEIKKALSVESNEEFFVKIIELKSGSVVVNYRVSWIPRDSQLTPEEMMKRIQSFLHQNNHRFMSRYTVNHNTIRTARVPDRCASSEKNGCDYQCEFSSELVDFRCLCPEGKIWDNDFNECFGDGDSTYTSEAVIEPSSEPEPKIETNSDYSSTPEPSSEPEPESNSGIESKSEPNFTIEPSREPETESEQIINHNSTSEPSSEPEPSSDSGQNHGIESKSESNFNIEPSSTPVPSSEPEPNSKPEPNNESETTSEEESKRTYSGEKKFKTLDSDENHEVNATSTKPVTEEFEDIPQPTESYITVSQHGRSSNEVNIFDMSSTTQKSINGTSEIIYSTTSPVNLWPAENVSESHDMSPFLPETENSQHKTEQKSYSVVENVSEGENVPHDQSPFLPAPENKHIQLSGTHGTMSEEADESTKKNTTEGANEDSKIIKIIPIRLETSTMVSHEPDTSTKSLENASTTVENLNVSITESVIKKVDEEEKSEDEEKEHEEKEDEANIFGEEVKEEKEEANKPSIESTTALHLENVTEMEKITEHHVNIFDVEEKSSTEIGETSVFPSTTETPILNIENSSTIVANAASSTTEIVTFTETLSTSTTNASISSIEFASSSTELPPTTKVEIPSTSEQYKSFDTFFIEEQTTTTSPVEISTQTVIKEDQTGAVARSKIKLGDFINPQNEDDIFDDNLLAVLPLKSKSIATPTTTEENLQHTHENEITEKTETTNHFLEQTTFPSVKSESDVALFNIRNGKVISEKSFENSNNQQNNMVKELEAKTEIVENIEEKLSTTSEIPKIKNKIDSLFKPGFLETIEACPEDKFKCVFSNECISKLKICDGKPQCADHSDEWNCQILTNTTNFLQIKYQDKILKVCATGWTNEMSDIVCQKQGFSGAIEWKSNKNSESREEKYLVAKTKALNDFEFSESCDDGIVEIECQEYVCGLNTTNRDAGEFAGLSLVVNKDSTRRCSANIISPLWAITSASCVDQPSEEWVLIAGNSELNMSKISKESVISLVNEIVTYPGNDYALLHLKQILIFTDSVYSVCLKENLYQSNECLTTGWLTKQDNSLEKYEKIVAVQGNCTSRNNELCVSPKSEASNECYNDRGAALYCYSYDLKRWLLNGIQTSLKDCGEKPELFTSLSRETIKWIKNTVGNDRMFL